MFVDAVTQKSRGGAKEAGFLPSHKSCPYHLHSLAEHIFPIDVLQVRIWLATLSKQPMPLVFPFDA